VPKGWPASEASAAECAAREAFEEAGVIGEVGLSSLGTFQYWKRAKRGRVFLQVAAFALRVEQVLGDWPERKERKRAWFTPDVAAKLAANAELATLIRSAAEGLRDPAAELAVSLAG
jgi:8-oxo-dGTP pyrophosphatase MutT (NUDIX family)